MSGDDPAVLRDMSLSNELVEAFLTNPTPIGLVTLRPGQVWAAHHSDVVVEIMGFCFPDAPVGLNFFSYDKDLYLVQPCMTSKRNQNCTYGPFITTFHRDTMFSTKVHTLSPGSMKLWCFERAIGQLNLRDEEDSEAQMLKVLANPLDYDFFLQEPGEVIEHDGGYAHFVMTFNRHDSQYGQWSALIGWEVNTPEQIYHSLKVETPLIEGKDGALEVVTEEDFMKTCSKVTRMSYSTIKEQENVKEHFMFKQRRNSLRGVDKLSLVKERNIVRYAGLKNRKTA